MSQSLSQHPRSAGHSEGLALMRKDEFLTALQTLKKTYSVHQGHILLLIDLASCYYMLNDYHNFHKWTLRSLEEFNLGYNQFSPTTQSRAILGLGKLLEEIGWVEEALILYRKKLSEEIEKKDRTEVHSSFFRLEAQALRLSAELKIYSEIPKAYVRCEQYKIVDSDIDYEIQSALMLCDFHMTSIQASYQRLLKIHQNTKYNQSDRKLAFFNFLFEALRENKTFKIDQAIFDSYPYFGCDYFEQCLLDIWNSEQGHTPIQVVDTNRSELLSFMSSVRYLALLSVRPNLDASREAQKKMLLFLQTISASSRNTILKQWSLERSSENIEIQIHPKELIHEGELIPCSAATLKILALFYTEKTLGLEFCVRELFDLDLSDSTFNRLRMSVQRINNSVGIKLGIKKLIKLTKGELTLNPAVKISIIKLP